MWQITKFAHHLMLLNLHSASSVSPHPESDRSPSTTFPTDKGAFLFRVCTAITIVLAHISTVNVFFTVRNAHIVSIVWRIIAGDTNFGVRCLRQSSSFPLWCYDFANFIMNFVCWCNGKGIKLTLSLFDMQQASNHVVPLGSYPFIALGCFVPRGHVITN